MNVSPRIATKRVAELVPADYNPRRISEQALAGLESSIDRFGLVEPIVWNEATGRIVGGHQRMKVLLARGIVETDVVVVNLTEPEEKALNVALNNPHIAGEFTPDLQALLREVEAYDDDLFTSIRLDELIADVPVDVDEDEDDGDGGGGALPANPVTEPGDVWLLGRHRMICGDCRDPDTVRRLVGDVRIAVAFTSPPYADRREYDESSGFRPIPPSEYVAWFAPVAANVRDVLAPDGSWFVNIKPGVTPDGLATELYVLELVLAHAREWGWNFATEFCWERIGVPKSVTRRFKNQFEPVYQFALGKWKMRPDAVRHESDSVPVPGGKGVGQTSWADAQGGNRSMFGGDRSAPGLAYPGNRLPPMMGSHDATGHTAAFPVGLPSFFFRAYSDPGDAVLDPFMGSGSSIMAAEKTDRVGFGVELSPAYCDVIVDRWEQATGGKATREDPG